jgi:hypothetical protein
MTVKIDSVEPIIFPDVEDLDARDARRNVEVFLDIRVDGKPTPVTVKLSYELRPRRSSGPVPKALIPKVAPDSNCSADLVLSA